MRLCACYKLILNVILPKYIFGILQRGKCRTLFFDEPIVIRDLTFQNSHCDPGRRDKNCKR